MKIIMFWIPILLIFTLVFKSFIDGAEFENHNIKIDNIIEINDLFISKITIAKYGFYDKEHKAILKTRGYIYYSINFVKIDLHNLKSKKFIVLDKLKHDIELDENKTGLYMIKEKNKLNDTLTFNYPVKALETLEKEANKKAHTDKVRDSAENFIKNYLKELGYKVNKVYWRDLTPETLSEKEKKDLFLDVKYNLIKCKIKTNNSQDSIDLKYKINRNGKIDPLILSKNINPQFAKCIHSSLLNLKHKEFYGKEEKVRKNFDLDKNKMCDFLEKDKILGIPKYYIKLKELNCDSSKSKTTNNTIGGKN